MAISSKLKIKAIVQEGDKNRFEYLLEQLHYLIRDIEVSESEYMLNNKDFSFVIAVTGTSHQSLVVELLTLNGFLIQSNDPKVNALVNNVNSRYLDELAQYASSIDLKKNVNKTVANLDKLIKDGNYSELVKICKDITFNPETVRKAKSNINHAVTNAIVKTIENVSKHKISVDTGIKDLLAIASDSQLKYHKCNEIMLQAANVAFELCTSNNNAISNLIKISNQKQENSLVNLKAAAKFSEIALSDEQKYGPQIKQAVRELNVRWLTNLVEPFREKLTEDENIHIDRLIDYIRKAFV